MATQEKKGKGGGAKTSRSETVTVRLEPKLRYLAEVAARVQRRTLSSYIEWAVEESLKNVSLEWIEGRVSPTSISETASRLWDVDEAERFVTLAQLFPNLLTHEEQILWKLTLGAEILWTGTPDEFAIDKKALREWFPGAKFAASSGADIEVIRAALSGDGAAVKAIGLDEFATSRKK